MKKFGLTTRIMIGLKRYRRLSEELIFNILFEYQHTAVSFVAKTYGISKATVYNLVNSFEMPKLNIERFETFFANYGKDRDKAHKVYFNGVRADTMEKVIETNCLPDIISEAGKGTNIPYLRGGESLIREILKEISQSRMIKKKQLKIFYYVIWAPLYFLLCPSKTHICKIHKIMV